MSEGPPSCSAGSGWAPGSPVKGTNQGTHRPLGINLSNMLPWSYHSSGSLLQAYPRLPPQGVLALLWNPRGKVILWSSRGFEVSMVRHLSCLIVKTRGIFYVAPRALGNPRSNARWFLSIPRRIYSSEYCLRSPICGGSVRSVPLSNPPRAGWRFYSYSVVHHATCRSERSLGPFWTT